MVAVTVFVATSTVLVSLIQAEPFHQAMYRPFSESPIMSAGAYLNVIEMPGLNVTPVAPISYVATILLWAGAVGTGVGVAADIKG